MMALKIIGSGSAYVAVHFRIEQSNASTPTPVCIAVSPVWSGSGVHVEETAPSGATPASTGPPPASPPLGPPPAPLLPPLHAAATAVRAQSAAATARLRTSLLPALRRDAGDARRRLRPRAHHLPVQHDLDADRP